jgi:two-component system sensor histidine kinase KdpD
MSAHKSALRQPEGCNPMKDRRPDPDQLLKVVSKELKQEGRGRLRIFFGAYAGVGKTYAMLLTARQQFEEGVSVTVGVVETHGREETKRLLDGLPKLPLRSIDYQGRVIQDFDVDAALSSGSQLVLVDELAHANPAGSRHAKRCGDVEELLAAGIDVYTTLNVQHLDSLADIVSGIIGIRVRETVPDSVFDDATEVVLVDLPPDDLLARLDAGKVYVPVAIEHARQNFFRKGNLIALRELALRRVADRVNADVRSYRLSNSIASVWPTRERLMVCVSAAKSQERLIAEGFRTAQRLQAECLVVHVQRSDEGDADQECLRSLARQAEALKIEYLNVVGDDVAEILLECARANNVTKLVLGHGTRRWNRPWRRQLSERIVRANPELGILLIAVKSTPPKTMLMGWKSQPPFSASSLVITAAACTVTTLIAEWLFQSFDAPNLVALFTLTVVAVSLRFGRVAAIWCALLSVLSFDFFFVPPLLSFAMSDTQYLFTFALILVIALVASEVGSRLRADARNARAGERREATVARVARDLSGALKSEQIVKICTETIAPLFEAKVALVVPDLSDRLHPTSAGGFEDLSVAQWTYDHVQRAGRATDTLSAAQALYLPLKAPVRCRGVLAIQPQDWKFLEGPDEKRLLEACCSLIALALERIHFAEVAQETLVRMEGERLRNSLLSAVSHDLRTPLTAIRGLAETLERETDLPEGDRAEVASAIRLQAEGLQWVVTNLLDLARMQSAGIRLNKEWHSLDEIVGSALARLGPALSKRQVRTDLPSDLPLLEADASLIERVLINLLDNAMKYTPPDAKILIGAKAVGDSMYCFVEDNGPGLPPGDPERFFEPFVRGQKESAISGVGLGLALCRSIIAAHGGTIRAEAIRPSGTRFEIRIPLGSPPGIEEENAA